jgi:hypothetical protein
MEQRIRTNNAEVPKLCPPPPGTLLVLWVVCMRDVFIFNEIWAQDKIYRVFWQVFRLKYFTYQLVPVLAPSYKQHILSPAKVREVS